MAESTLEQGSTDDRDVRDAASEPTPMLVLVHSTSAPERVGEVLIFPREVRTTSVFGRGNEPATSGMQRVSLMRRRPGRLEPAAPFDDPFLSRRQLAITIEGQGLRVRNVGKRPMLVRDQQVGEALLGIGDAFEIKGHLVFQLVERPLTLPTLQHVDEARVPFGEADDHGIVGESDAVWSLRDAIGFVGPRPGHVLVTGESGTGKELVARALHALSSRAQRPLVARNAATFPTGLIDAELFGNAANYPNAGMAERPGIIGEASGSTLLLDEIGELPSELQSRFLRVLDQGGEYQRLGDAKRRTSDLRVIGATNRAVSELKHDLVARFRHRIEVPSLNERREDVPLLLRHLMRAAARDDREVRARFFEGTHVRVSSALVAALVSQRYSLNVRELDALMWSALAGSRGDTLELAASMRPSLAPAPSARQPAELTRDEIEACLRRNEGVQERVWRELGLASRHVLTRLLRKHGIAS